MAGCPSYGKLWNFPYFYRHFPTAFVYFLKSSKNAAYIFPNTSLCVSETVMLKIDMDVDFAFLSQALAIVVERFVMLFYLTLLNCGLKWI